jgi:hypothetical protein
VWDATTFTKNRDRLLEGDMAAQFLTAVLSQDKVKGFLSSEHFSVDGMLLEAWASLKSFRPKDGSGEQPGPGRNGERDFPGERRRNDTHASTTDPDARLFRKGPGKEARLCFMGHTLMENRRSDCPRRDYARFGPCRAVGGAGADRAPVPSARSQSRSGLTKAMAPANLSWSCATTRSPRVFRRTPAVSVR